MERVKEIRKKAKQTQKEFAERFEIPIQTYKQWECGQRKPPEYVIKMILKLCEQ